MALSSGGTVLARDSAASNSGEGGSEDTRTIFNIMSQNIGIDSTAVEGNNLTGNQGRRFIEASWSGTDLGEAPRIVLPHTQGTSPTWPKNFAQHGE